MNNNFAIIMAGGVGSRFWPMSRSSFPKQFIDILGIGKSLIQLTYGRLKKILPEENIYIITNAAYKDLVMEQIPFIDEEHVICEPSAKNTATCIAYASYKLAKLNPFANCIVAPSDHLILDEAAFIETIQKAFKFSEESHSLVTLGMKPHRPDTGYGYIQFKDDENEDGFYKVKTFTEKPNLELANTFLESGDFLWNAGIFVWTVKAILAAFHKYLPEMDELFSAGKGVYNTDREKAFVEKTYSLCTNISIDYGIMEKAENVYVIPADFGWSDLGTWTSLYEVSNKDEHDNVIIGKQVLTEDTQGCMIHANNKMVVLNGVKDLIVVDTQDTLLIADKSREQEIKQLVNDIRIKFDEKYT